jgi:hypothetical protein
MNTATARHNTNAWTIAGTIATMGSGLKEPELCAACELTERAVMLAVRYGVKTGLLAMNPRCPGEVVHGPVYVADRRQVAGYVAACDAMFDRMYGQPHGTSAAERAAGPMALRPAVTK